VISAFLSRLGGLPQVQDRLLDFLREGWREFKLRSVRDQKLRAGRAARHLWFVPHVDCAQMSHLRFSHCGHAPSRACEIAGFLPNRGRGRPLRAFPP